MRGAANGEFHGYVDASFVNNHDLTSTSGNVFILNGGAITWSSKKELSLVLSTTEAKFNSMAHAEKDITYDNIYRGSTMV